MLGYFGKNLEERIQLNLKQTFLQMLFFCGFVVGFFLHHSGTAVCRDEQIRLMVQLQSF